MATAAAAKPNLVPIPIIQTVRRDAHWGWLERGWRDFMLGWKASLMIGLLVFFASVGIVWALFHLDLGVFIPVALGAFAIAGPTLAVGVYGVSARVEAGETINGPSQLFARMASPGQVAFIGFCLFVVIMVWARLAVLLYALCAGTTTFMPGAEFVRFALMTPQGLTMIALGTAVGGFLAALAFAMSAVSIPMVANRRIDAMTAMVLSVRAVWKNPMAMFSWAFVIVLMVVGSMVAFLIPLAFVLPWLGHATWHAYREIVTDP